MKVSIVVADFYADIADALLRSCAQELAAAGVDAPRIARVPGALEIPFALRVLGAARNPPDAMIALGCVIRGETHHFHVVADVCARGILQAQMQTGIPAGNGVLTTDTAAQARARTDKGAHAARAAMRLAELAADVKNDA